MSTVHAADTFNAQGRDLPEAFFRRSDARGLIRLVLHFTLLLTTGTLVHITAGNAYLCLVAMLVHGVVLTFLFAPLHECIHRTAFESRWLNDAVASVCGFLLLLPRQYFRAFHLSHHQHTQDPQRDPELAVAKPATVWQYLIHLSGWTYWRDNSLLLLRHGAGRVTAQFIRVDKRSPIAKEARLHLGLYGIAALWSVYSGSTAILIYWVVPVVLGQPFLRAFLLAEHTGCPLVPDMLKNSRTTRTNFLVKLLAWNMPYHAEHHAFAAVPFHALPGAHEVLKERISVQAAGYSSVHQGIWRRLGGRAG